jgi:hypothetical protein
MSHLVAATNKALSTVLVGRANGPCYFLIRVDIDVTGFH